MTAQPHNRFVFCVVAVEFAVNGNQALRNDEQTVLLSVLEGELRDSGSISIDQ